MRILTATNHLSLLLGILVAPLIGVLMVASTFVAFVFLALLLAFLGAFLGGLAMAGADLGLEHLAAGHEGARLAQAGDHLHAVPQRHFGHLSHDAAHLL